jgi:phosphoserine phosphatase RsbU/P
VYAPLKTQERVLGGIVLGRAQGQAIFTASDEKLLMALARQAAVAVDNARLHQEVLVKERLEHELQLARDVQASLIPSHTPVIPGWDFAAYWNPAREVAGDFYDFIANVGARRSERSRQAAQSQESLLHGIVIADVSDKGMHAALFMALTRSVLRAATTAGQSPVDSVNQSNRLLCADSTGGMFVTMFYAQLDSAKNEMTYVNAGHNPPYLYRAKEKKIEELERTGIMLGFDEEMRFEQRAVQFYPGDFIVFYTDGVTEVWRRTLA